MTLGNLLDELVLWPSDSLGEKKEGRGVES